MSLRRVNKDPLYVVYQKYGVYFVSNTALTMEEAQSVIIRTKENDRSEYERDITPESPGYKRYVELNYQVMPRDEALKIIKNIHWLV